MKKITIRLTEFWVIHGAQFKLAEHDPSPSFAPWARCSTWREACVERKKLAKKLLEGQTNMLEIVRISFVSPRKSLRVEARA